VSSDIAIRFAKILTQDQKTWEKERLERERESLLQQLAICAKTEGDYEAAFIEVCLAKNQVYIFLCRS
jgi:hypothetical protein